MSKLTPELIEQAAKQVGIDDEKRANLVAMIADMVAPEEEKEPQPRVKKQFCILISDPLGVLPKADLVGWVLQIPEDESPATTEERIVRAVEDFNTSKRGRLLPCQTVGEACENIPARFFKQHAVWVKTKTPVLMLRTRNEIKNTPSVLGEDRGGAK